MDKSLAIETLSQLKRYTWSAMKLLGVEVAPRRRNHSGPYVDDEPSGVICHYTASNAAIGPKRPYGRLPVLLSRLRPLSGQGVGCHVVVWDEPVPRLAPLKARFPLIQGIPSEVFFFGDELALWHAGAANRWSLGIEVRNCGELVRSSRGAFYWCRGRHRYRGREPIVIGEHYWEPFTYSQMVGTLWISRLFAAAHPIVPHRFLGHTHVSSTRVDPGPHFPLHELREAVFNTPDIPLLSVPYLREFQRQYEAADETLPHDDPFISEHSLHQGLYRHDWDGRDSITDPEVEAERLRIEHADPDQLHPQFVVDLKKALRRLGYYPGPIDDDDFSQELVDTLRLFQGRWKKRAKRGKRRRWISAVPVTGKVNQQVLNLIHQFEQQQWKMVS